MNKDEFVYCYKFVYKNNKVLSLVSRNWDSLARILIYNKINNTIYINSNKRIINLYSTLIILN